MMIPSAAKAALRKKTRLFTLRRPDRGTSSAPCGSLKPQLFFPAFLERLDLVADRRRCHIELVDGLGKAQVAAGGLEGAQGVEGWEATLHEMSA